MSDQNQWRVFLMSEDGQTSETTFSTRWDPEKVSLEEIGRAAAAEAYWFVGKGKKKFMATSAELIAA